MAKVLVIGAAGMLGQDVMHELKNSSPRGVGRKELDITDADAVNRLTEGWDVIVNTAAYTKVDECESHPEEAFRVNATGPRNIARAARLHGARVIQVSTDYVFDGTAASPYTENSPTNPLSVYGSSKLAGEQAVIEEHPEGAIVLRTSWLYATHGKSFPRTILEAAAKRDYLRVVDDQWGQPTWTRDVAAMVGSLIRAEIPTGIFHATNAGSTTWCAFARELFALAGWDTERVVATTSEEFAQRAPRPAWSVLGHDPWALRWLPSPRPWTEALEEAWEAGVKAFAKVRPPL